MRSCEPMVNLSQRWRARLLLSAVALSLGVACNDKPEGWITLTFGEEQGTLTRAPAPTTLIVDAIATDDSRREMGRIALPAESLDLGEEPPRDSGAVSVRAIDAAGKT